MNKPDELAAAIKQSLEAAIVHVKDAEKAAAESSQTYKMRIINELIDAETRLAVLSNAIITGDIKDDLKWKAAVFRNQYNEEDKG